MRIGLNAVALAAVGVLVVGCSQEETGTPQAQPSSSESSSASSSAPSEEQTVPAVQDPLGGAAEGFAKKPCELVKQSDVAGFGYSEPGQADTESTSSDGRWAGPQCVWFAGADMLGVGIGTGNRDQGTGGLQGSYDSYKSNYYKRWEPTTVNGYPAAYTGVDEPSSGNCMLVVGIADDLAFNVSTDVTGTADEKCTTATKVARLVVDTLKKGS